MKDWIKQLDKVSFGNGSYSQSYQDQLLDIVFDNVGTTNHTPFCVEFGFNSTALTSGSGANVANLVLERGWSCLLLDGDNENPSINLHKHFLLPSTIAAVFKQYHVPSQPEYISIDVDSTDLWLFESLLGTYKAMLYSVEYNSNYPLDSAITFPNDPNERWQGDRGYGASLKALDLVARRHGYSLLWVVPSLDAFFIRNDLIDDHTEEISFPFEKWRAFTGVINHGPLKNRDRVNIFVDYEVYLATNGDLSSSRKAANAVCKRYLLDTIPQRVIRKARRMANLVAGNRGSSNTTTRE